MIAGSQYVKTPTFTVNLAGDRENQGLSNTGKL